MSIPFGREHTVPTDAFEAEPKSSDPGEQIYEAQRWSRLGDRPPVGGLSKH